MQWNDEATARVSISLVSLSPTASFLRARCCPVSMLDSTPASTTSTGTILTHYSPQLLVAILTVHNVKLDYEQLAQYMGPGKLNHPYN